MAKKTAKNVVPATVLNGEKETKGFFLSQKETDVWQTCYTNELVVKGVANAPILMESIKQDMDMEHVSDNAMLSCMENYKLAIGYPTETKMMFYPIRETGYKSLSERAGISGRTMSSTEDKASQKEMNAETKAYIFNEGLQCYTNKSLVLVRDGAISAVLSGDENDYCKMPVSDLIEELETSMIDYVGSFELRSATCDYEIAKVIYEIIDDDMKREIMDVFRFITRGDDCRIYVWLVTSDVGSSGANLHSVIEFSDNKQIMLGEGLKTLHKGKRAFDVFRQHTQGLYSYFVDNARKIAELKNIRVKYAGGCARNLACAKGFPKKESLSALERLDNLGNATAFDVYSAMFDIIEEYYNNREAEDRPMTEKELIEMQQKASEVAFMDFKRNDYPFEWKNVQTSQTA